MAPETSAPREAPARHRDPSGPPDEASGRSEDATSRSAEADSPSHGATVWEGEAPARHDPRGLRLFIMGAIVAVLAPLAGFLGGSVVGRSEAARFDPMFVWLFAGLAVGAAGAFLAFIGGLRWISFNRGRL